MVAPLELVMKDSVLQENLFRRIVAIVIDGILLAIVYFILAAILFAGWFFSGYWWVRNAAYGHLASGAFGFGVLSLFLGILGILYFAFMESYRGATIGKQLMSLKVVGENGEKPLIASALIRNISRIHWVLFLLDLIGGLIMEGDPRQRFSDRIAKTVVYYQSSTRTGPFVSPKILTQQEASAAAPPSGTAPSAPTTPPAASPAPAQPEAAPTEPAKPAEQPKPEEAKTFCRHCGAELKSDSKFCAQCGKQL